jgi:uncharacterized protein (DUF305 family)
LRSSPLRQAQRQQRQKKIRDDDTLEMVDIMLRAAQYIAFAFKAAGLVAIGVPVGYCMEHALGAPEGERPFLAANETAMNAMMSGMAIHPSGNVDVDFAAMMIPHHEGAVDMAKAELQYGKNEQLRRIAQEIIVDQEQEIAAMRLAVKTIQSHPPPPR